MDNLTKTPSYSPLCPNHGVALEGCGFPLPAKGTGKCPVSGADFDFEADTDESKITVDKDGNKSKAATWKINGGSAGG